MYLGFLIEQHPLEFRVCYQYACVSACLFNSWTAFVIQTLAGLVLVVTQLYTWKLYAIFMLLWCLFCKLAC